MEELKELFQTVTSFSASCGMSKEQIDVFHALNKKYNQLTKGHFNYSICSKKNLISKVENYISQNGNATN